MFFNWGLAKYVTKMYGEVKIQLHALLIVALEGQCLDSFLSHFTAEESVVPPV
jgi:hypothetical protein